MELRSFSSISAPVLPCLLSPSLHSPPRTCWPTYLPQHVTYLPWKSKRPFFKESSHVKPRRIGSTPLGGCGSSDHPCPRVPISIDSNNEPQDDLVKPLLDLVPHATPKPPPSLVRFQSKVTSGGGGGRGPAYSALFYSRTNPVD